MFFDLQTTNQQNEYVNLLKLIGALSNLFSESAIPYLHYRVAERLFCKAFDAEDLSRSDVSADAKKGLIGIGLKTFLANNNKSLQKIAEFNNDRPQYKDLNSFDKIKKIAELRNSRIEFTESVHGINNSIYHCIIRGKGIFSVFEEPMHLIDIGNIKNIKAKSTSISFNDDKSEYSFSLSKSTLFKRFNTQKVLNEFDVDILNDPIEQLQDCFLKRINVLKKDISLEHSSLNELNLSKKERIKRTIFLPLYGSKQKVYERSGLNQWNAKGRPRHPNEVYIPVPIIIHKYFPDFFPDRETPFSLKLPNGKTMKSKICQENGKALMSYSNRELGDWILRDILKLKVWELLTYDKLKIFGIDSVRIDKISDLEFEINFSENNSFENFIQQFS